MVTVLGPVTLKTTHGAILVLRDGDYKGMCLEPGCDWIGDERETPFAAESDLLRHKAEHI